MNEGLRAINAAKVLEKMTLTEVASVCGCFSCPESSGAAASAAVAELGRNLEKAARAGVEATKIESNDFLVRARSRGAKLAEALLDN